MIDRKPLLNDLKKQVAAVERDLAEQVKQLFDVRERLDAEHKQARKLGRTAATWNSWLEERITQVAVAWVLGTVFVRFCEDNRLIPEPYITAPITDGREVAQARYEAYMDEADDPTYRGWLEQAFAELGSGQAGKLLFDERHNPLYQIPLSHDGAGALLEFWRTTNEAGALAHDFTDPLEEDGDGTQGWDTRFLGDLYQDLSEAARKMYALLQTPEFVEEFILDRTMDPAVREFGFVELKMIDPTCGSGHFVLGAFRRLVRLWRDERPGVGRYERVKAALGSVHGVDVNPFAVAIARFRLLVAAMTAAEVRTLAEAEKYEWPMHLAVGDSLLAKAQEDSIPGLVIEDHAEPAAKLAYTTEDWYKHPRILEPGRYHVVVGNPPYITVKDPKLNERYRELYDACTGTYALSVPFAQRFFELAKSGYEDGTGKYGKVGQITANSFMKREFGTKIITEFFAHQVGLTEVIDTSGAYIPGHGTPTVVLVGERRGHAEGRCETIRTVRSVQGEPTAPENAEDGHVWKAIIEQIEKPGSVSQWVSVDDLSRGRYFSKQPWVLADGGLEMVEELASRSVKTMKQDIEPPIGRAIRAGADEAYIRPLRPTYRTIADAEGLRPLMVGEVVRDWGSSPQEAIWFPYAKTLKSGDLSDDLWHLRTLLAARRTFQGDMAAAGLQWWDYMQFTASAYKTPLSIAFAFVATHNHFVLDRGGKVFKQSAPVIKLRQRASEEEHLRLLGLLNSSTAGFWLKMVSHSKGTEGHQSGIKTELWEQFYEFTGTKLLDFPIPVKYPTALATDLDSLAQRLASSYPSAVVAAEHPTPRSLREARARYKHIRARMIALQEEMDWHVYHLYDLHPEDLCLPNPDDVPDLTLGERAFEIVLARRVAAEEASDEWFKRHGSKPIIDIPADWPAVYRDLVQKRINAIESSRAIGMVERPEYKRRWASEDWETMQEKALKSWLLDRIEDRSHWYDANSQPTIVTLARLTDELSQDNDFLSVANLYAPRQEIAKVVADLMSEEHVPFVSALRYKPAAVKKREDWERVWDMQRQEDAAEDEATKQKIREATPVPPKYGSADFLRSPFWRHRGKLDVPKERFISYGAENVQLPTLYGWAGWDHREQAQALASHFASGAVAGEEITPFLAGLLELQPWLSQWHDEFDMNYGGSPADILNGYLQQLKGEHGLTDEQLRAWRPHPATRGRRAKAGKARKQ